MPTNPYLVSGTVYTGNGTSQDSNVQINSDISITTDDRGRYLLDLANLDSGYTSGSSYSIVANDEFDNENVSDTITVSGQNQTKDLFLTPRSRGQGRPGGSTYVVEMRTVGNNVVTADNPIYIKNDERPLTRRVSQNAYPKYIGEAPPGTPTSSARWRIKYVEAGGQVTWANGNSNMNKVWDDRTTYEYS